MAVTPRLRIECTAMLEKRYAADVSLHPNTDGQNDQFAIIPIKSAEINDVGQNGEPCVLWICQQSNRHHSSLTKKPVKR
ncbi:MAG: hypothetical protein AAGJ84_04225 [Pseudomonadota bacterium]